MAIVSYSTCSLTGYAWLSIEEWATLLFDEVLSRRPRKGTVAVNSIGSVAESDSFYQSTSGQASQTVALAKLSREIPNGND